MHGLRRDAQGALVFSGTPVAELFRQAKVVTPAYLYDLDAIVAGARALEASFGAARHLTAYAVKANTAGTILRALAREGIGADVVSGGELEVALGAGIAPEKIVMSGVGKADWEIDLAIGRGIFAVQLESIEEVGRVAARARALGKQARVAPRIKPGVDIGGHAHIATGHDEAKFGVARGEVHLAWQQIDRLPELRAVGVSAHVGSSLREPEPYLAAARVVSDVARERLASGAELEYVDFGGGFGIDYGGKPAAEPGVFVGQALALLREVALDHLALVIEPGRSIVGAHGALVASVTQTKQSGDRRWVMIDAGMNDLIRPALYAAKHRVELLDAEPAQPEWRVVGPVCESSDDFGAHPLGPAPSGLVAIRDAGAYGFVLASEYNGRPLPAEVFVSGGQVIHVSHSPNRTDWVRRRLQA